MGAASDNAAILPSIASQAVALKMYLNDTYSTLKMDNVSLWMEVGLHGNAKANPPRRVVLPGWIFARLKSVF